MIIMFEVVTVMTALRGRQSVLAGVGASIVSLEKKIEYDLLEISSRPITVISLYKITFNILHFLYQPWMLSYLVYIL